MAGDWIKVEHSTPDKPETHLLAEMLGLTVDDVFGKLIKFWMWVDRNSRHGDVTHMSRNSLDALTHCPGFAAALEVIGWASFDREANTLTIPNFDRHNGSSAKTRALAKDRKGTQRSRESHAEPVTREEKRRVSTSLRSVDREAELPDWLPKPVWQEFVAFRRSQKGWTRKAETLLLADLAKLKAQGHDPTAVINQSIKNGWKGLFQISVQRQTKADKNASVAEQMYGNVVREMNEQRDAIAGSAQRVD